MKDDTALQFIWKIILFFLDTTWCIVAYTFLSFWEGFYHYNKYTYLGIGIIISLVLINSCNG